MKNKNIPVFFVFFFSILYFEVLFRVFASSTFFSLSFIYTLFYGCFLSFLFSFLVRLFSLKVNRVLFLGIMFFLSVWYSAEIIFKNSFQVYFSFSTLFFSDQAFSFLDKVLEIIFSFYPILFLLFLPIFFCFLFIKRIFLKKNRICYQIVFLCLSGMCYLFFLGFVFDFSHTFYSPQKLYFESFSNALNKETFGALPSLFIEIRKMLFPKTLEISQGIMSKNEDVFIRYPSNTLDISFPLENERDEELLLMHQYFMNESGTLKNEYTGLFKDKNLILILAESFNSIAVSPFLTPTLYQLSHEGFVFSQFYSPLILSTIGGEFQTLTSLYPNMWGLSHVFKKGKTDFLFSYGEMFSKALYDTYAYHNHDYSFQNRDLYLKSTGLTNYFGCGNGLEKKISCDLWPKSDVEMISSTVDDYIHQEKFFTYYVTVSGHMSYNFKTNDMAIKNKTYTEHLPYSSDIQAYLATQIELDHALSYLIQALDQEGILEDTVIALVGDHYPYDISLNHINEIASPKRDATIEINRSHFILWNKGMESVTIDKVGGNMDVLPTILNLFDLPYDSRLLMGKDLLSSDGGLVIFHDNSWVSDKGVYYASLNQFEPKVLDIPSNYVQNVNQIVSNRIYLSKLLLDNNYYRKVLGE